MKKVFLLGLLCACLLLGACHMPKTNDPLAYADTAFTLTVRGEFSYEADPSLTHGTVGKTRAEEPLAFAAEVSSEPLPTGTVMEGLPSTGKAYRVSVTYTAPESLAGLSVTCAYGGQETATTATLTYPSPTGELSVSLPYEAVEGLLAPVLVLIPHGDVSEVEPVKEGGWTVTCTESDGGQATYHFTKENGYPTKVEAQEHGQRVYMYVSPDE